jgi:hypothetical protein
MSDPEVSVNPTWRKYMSYCFLIRFMYDLKVPFMQRMSFNEFQTYAEKILR